MADARTLVELLGTGDEIDPKIGDRVFRTKSREELLELVTVVEWAKAARLVQVNRGRLVPVKKSAPLPDRPRPGQRAFRALGRPGRARVLAALGMASAS